MQAKSIIASLGAFALLAACGAAESAPQDAGTKAKETVEQVVKTSFDNSALEGVPSAAYGLDINHSFLSVSFDHGAGLSDYVIVFTDYSVDINLDVEDLTQSSVNVEIDPSSIFVNYVGDYKATHADSPFDTWAEDISFSENWLNAGNFPNITFISTNVERHDDNKGKVTGDLTFLGVTKPVTLDVKFRGAMDNRWAPGKVIGFDATTKFDRSEFGSTTFIPAIGDEIRLNFSAEFMQAAE